jgi:hypothetical protein
MAGAWSVVRRINTGFHKRAVHQYKNILIFFRTVPAPREIQGSARCSTGLGRRL